jgi:hypothetical protein
MATSRFKNTPSVTLFFFLSFLFIIIKSFIFFLVSSLLNVYCFHNFMTLFMCSFISHYCLLHFFVCVFLFSYFRFFYLFILISRMFIYSYVRILLPYIPPLLSFLPTPYFYFLHSSFLCLYFISSFPFVFLPW